MEQFRLLLVDDDENIRRALKRIFRGDEFFTETAADGVEALEKCRATRFHAAVIDMMMPRMDGRELLTRLKAEYPDTAVIVLTAHGSIESAVDSMRTGADDYLPKPFHIEEVRDRVVRACRLKMLEAENLRLKDELKERHRHENLVGSSPRMQKVFELIDRVSGNESTVLIRGESGTGKEQVARAIHYSGPRGKEPFVPVDCGAISPTLIESELFGHEKGAFTGAHSATEGLLRAAGSGTIFLDEIGELPLDVQARLLRALQEKEVRPVGGTRSLPIAARVIAATNRDLDKAVKEGEFREDLFYRLNVISIDLPPLRERSEDVPIITCHLLEKMQQRGGRLLKVAPEAMKLLAGYAWPGNIRELQNALEHAAAMGGSGDVIGPADLPERVRAARPGSAGRARAEGGSLDDFEKQAVLSALEQAGGSRRKAAAILGVSEPTLYRKLKRHGITES